MRSSDDGYVTAEAAVVMPALMLLVAMLLWGLMAAVAKIQCVDAAWVGARAAARGDPAQAVRAAVTSAAPEGARARTLREGGLVRVRVRARTAGPGPLRMTLEADAVALDEDRPADRPEGAAHGPG